MNEKIIRPWVDVETDDNGDLQLWSGLDGLGGIRTKISHTVISLQQKETTKWLKDKGWATPEEKTELLEALEKLHAIMSKGGVWTIEDQKAAYEAIVKAKGDQE